MVKRKPLLALALLLAGCPDDVGQGVRKNVSSALAAPQSLVGVPDGGSKVVLTWNDPNSVETGHRLEVNDAPFGTPTVSDVRLLAADAVTMTYPTSPNTTYYFRVVAVTDTIESDPSNVVAVLTPPAPPSGLIVNPVDASHLGVSWQDGVGEASYLVEHSADGGTTWVAAGSVPADATSVFVGGLAPDTEYLVRVVADSPAGRSDPSLPAAGLTTSALVSYYYLPVASNDGRFPSMAVESPGSQHIAHYDASTSKLMYTSRAPGISSYVTITADGGATGTADVGGDGTSLALEATGLTPVAQRRAHLVGHDRTGGALRYATDSTGSWVKTTLDAGGARPRIVRNASNGTLHVVYQDLAIAGAPILRYARKAPGQGWTTWDLINIPLTATTNHSIALDASGALHVLLVESNGWLHHIVRPNADPSGMTGQQILYPSAHGVPDYTALAIDGAGTVHAIYRGSLSKSLHELWQTAGSGSWTLSTIDQEAGVDLGGGCSAFAIPGSNRIHVAYQDGTRMDLRYASKDPGGAWVRRVIDAAAQVGPHVSVATFDDALLYFAYRDDGAGRMKVAIRQP